jgi:hypothetical protein
LRVLDDDIEILSHVLGAREGALNDYVEDGPQIQIVGQHGQRPRFLIELERRGEGLESLKPA